MSTSTEAAQGKITACAGQFSEEAVFILHLENRECVPLNAALAEFERALLRWALTKAGGKQAQAARLLSTPRSTFQYRWARLCPPEPPLKPADAATGAVA